MVLTLASQMVALVLFHQGIAAGVPLVAGASIVYFEIEFVLSSLLPGNILVNVASPVVVEALGVDPPTGNAPCPNCDRY